MKQTIRLFGLWRLIAALLVMAYHYAHSSANADVIVPWFEHMGPLLDMFFIMSGFLIFQHYGTMTLDRHSYLSFLARRLSRLYPLHLITLTFFVAFATLAHTGLIQSAGTHTRYAWDALPANILLVQAWGVQDTLTYNYVSWSLSAEWFAYLIFPLVVAAFLWGRIAGLALMLAAILIGLEIADAGATSKAEQWFDARTWGAYRVAADFVFGALICAVTRRFPVGLRAQWPAWAVMALVFWSMFGGGHPYLSLALIGVALYLGAIAEFNHPPVSAWMNPFMPVAAVSFGIYLWHPVMELFFYSLVWKRVFSLEGEAAFWAYMLLPAIATIIVSLVSAQYFEKPVGKRMQAAMLDWIGRSAARRMAR